MESEITKPNFSLTSLNTKNPNPTKQKQTAKAFPNQTD
jgi:hypothetical protein